MNQQFSFHRMRYTFVAREPVSFPFGTAANTVRGALGWALHGASEEVYRSLFEPVRPKESPGPSGFSAPPRPFVLRASHLNGATTDTGDPFHLDVHVFHTGAAPLACFSDAFEKVAARGFGGRGGQGRCQLTKVQSVDLAGEVHANVRQNSVSLAADSPANGTGTHSISIRFVTPTELKTAGKLARLPEFPVLFARARDRVRSLCSLSGRAIELDFEGLTQRSEQVSLHSHQLVWEKVERTSRKTGQKHPLGGFLGTAHYEGELEEFLPLLHAAGWTGVGRQTVWGKGEIALGAGVSD